MTLTSLHDQTLLLERKVTHLIKGMVLNAIKPYWLLLEVK